MASSLERWVIFLTVYFACIAAVHTTLSLERWVGKVAVVTGASSGIGAATAEELVKQGLVVAGLARRADRIEKLADKLSGEKGKLHAIKCDVTKEEDILKAFKYIKDNLGPVHILINNAGISQPTTLIDGNTEMWKKTFDVNVLGLCMATREAVRNMRANNVTGHIIHINSVLGHKVPNFPYLNVYPASKYAVTALAESLRVELNSMSSKIKITSISPGRVNTEIAEANGFDLSGVDLSSIPSLDPKDIAESILYVLSTPPHVQVHELTIEPVNEAI